MSDRTQSYYSDVCAWDSATGTDPNLELRLTVIYEEVEELFEAIVRWDSEAIVKESADVIWTILGLMNGLRIPFDEVWDAVLASNNSKILPDGRVLRRPDGKILKPPSWTPPDIAGVLHTARARQGDADDE